MGIWWNNTNVDTAFDTSSPCTFHTMPSCDQQYNINWEIIECLEIVYEILDDLENIRIALWKKKDPSHILSPPFDPFKTIGRYR
jgi:hypothetical protein